MILHHYLKMYNDYTKYNVTVLKENSLTKHKSLCLTLLSTLINIYCFDFFLNYNIYLCLTLISYTNVSIFYVVNMAEFEKK